MEDSLWLLARQWQLGEFRGDDAGSPIGVRVEGEAAPLVGYRAPAAAPAPLGAGLVESVVASEAVLGDTVLGADRRLAAMIGLRFLRDLADRLRRARRPPGAYRAAFLDAYPLPPPPAGALAGDGPPGAFSRCSPGRPRTATRSCAPFGPPQPPATPAIAPADREAVAEAARSWVAWCGTLFSERPAFPPTPNGASPTQVVYRLATAIPEHWIPLVPEHRAGGRRLVRRRGAGGLGTLSSSAERSSPCTMRRCPTAASWSSVRGTGRAPPTAAATSGSDGASGRARGPAPPDWPSTAWSPSPSGGFRPRVQPAASARRSPRSPHTANTTTSDSATP